MVARFDFDQSPDAFRPNDNLEATEEAPSVSIIYNEAAPDLSEDTAFVGYYIDTAMLQDPNAVYEAIQTIEVPTVVMIDLKSSSGMFYYSTDIAGAQFADVDVATVDAIIAYLRTHGFTVIARVQSFRDRAYALEHLSYGLAIDGGALWSEKGNYWLDPGEEAVLEYFQQIAKELSSRGITEIVFDDFYFPGSSSIVYKHDISRTQLINQAADTLVGYFNSTNVTISFGNPSSDFQTKDKKSHIVIDRVDAAKVSSILSGFSNLQNPDAQLVFLTNSKDTRFDGHNLLRPLLQN